MSASNILGIMSSNVKRVSQREGKSNCDFLEKQMKANVDIENSTSIRKRLELPLVEGQ